MNLNARKPFQIGAVSLALTMLASYVVYSQRQAAQNIAPGSKSDVIINRTAVQQQQTVTGEPIQRSSSFVASSSKSIAPVFTIPSTNSSKGAKGQLTNINPMLFPGSKSAAVFRPKDVTVLMPRTSLSTNSFLAPLPQVPQSAPHPTFTPVTNTTASLKP